MGLDEIVLTKAEMRMLKFLSESDAVLLMADTRDLLLRLEHFGLAEISVVSRDVYNEAVEKTGDWIPKAAKITDKGWDYLAYQSAKKADSRESFRRDVLLVVISAAVASLMTLLTERLPLLLEIMKSILQRGGK